jgi:hypothetical protein
MMVSKMAGKRTTTIESVKAKGELTGFFFLGIFSPRALFHHRKLAHPYAFIIANWARFLKV